jgi:chromosome partitioning protein
MPFRTVKALGAAAAGFDVIIIDGAPHASGLTLELAGFADKVIIPTGSPMVELSPSVRLAFELKNKGITGIQFALIRILSEAEAVSAREGLEEQKLDVAKIWLHAAIGYANAIDSGLGEQEAAHWSLRKRGKAFVESLAIPCN